MFLSKTSQTYSAPIRVVNGRVRFGERMHLVVFGLTISSSWGNGHATLWRSLVRALGKQGHTVTFYEKDVPYYADTRDLWQLTDGAKLRLYSNIEDVREQARRERSRVSA